MASKILKFGNWTCLSQISLGFESMKQTVLRPTTPLKKDLPLIKLAAPKRRAVIQHIYYSVSASFILGAGSAVPSQVCLPLTPLNATECKVPSPARHFATGLSNKKA